MMNCDDFPTPYDAQDDIDLEEADYWSTIFEFADFLKSFGVENVKAYVRREEPKVYAAIWGDNHA